MSKEKLIATEAKNFDQANGSNKEVPINNLIKLGYGRQHVLRLFDEYKRKEEIRDTESLLQILRNTIGNQNLTVSYQHSTAGLYAINFHFNEASIANSEDYKALQTLLATKFLSKLTGDHKFNLVVGNSSNTNYNPNKKDISINTFTLQVGDAFHLVKEPVGPAVNAALETLTEFNLINAHEINDIKQKFIDAELISSNSIINNCN